MNNSVDIKDTSFVEQSARQRVKGLLDAGTMRELISPFDRVTSPWLAKQGIVSQFDDGAVIARGTIDGEQTIVAAIEGSFQGGSLGEVSGAKIAGALELAVEENANGNPMSAVLILESGGVRLQEANLGLAAIAEIQSAIVALRKHRPVIALVTGPVGCFGGMSISAALCSYIIMTREGRLGLNGPLVIEQEAGIAEYNASDRPFIWSVIGGKQRYESGLVDSYINDSQTSARDAVVNHLDRGVPDIHRSEKYADLLGAFLQIDTYDQITPTDAQQLLMKGIGNE